MYLNPCLLSGMNDINIINISKAKNIQLQHKYALTSQCFYISLRNNNFNNVN